MEKLAHKQKTMIEKLTRKRMKNWPTNDWKIDPQTIEINIKINTRVPPQAALGIFWYGQDKQANQANK